MAKKHLIYIVSGGVGHSGEQIVRTVLAQFPENAAEVKIEGRIRTRGQVEEIAAQAARDGGLVVHTMVNGELRRVLSEQLKASQVPTVDLVGPLIEQFGRVFEQEPSGVPGLYRQQRQSHFDRVAAIDYSLEHDDGVDPAGWLDADVILIGPSRTGKTPISMYLAVLGWKVANYPIVPGVNIPANLDDLPPHKIIGLTIDPVRLQAHRRQRQRELGTAVGKSAYTDLEKIYEELEQAERVYRQRGFRKVDVTDKPIETCADEVLRLVPSRD